MRVFLDTNVLVSAYATRGLCSDVLKLVLAEHELITAEVVLDELSRVLEEKIHLPSDVVNDIIVSLRDHPVEPTPNFPASLPADDPDDAWVLAAALASRAEALVTGDPHLLNVAGAVSDLRIVSPRGFWSLLRSV